MWVNDSDPDPNRCVDQEYHDIRIGKPFPVLVCKKDPVKCHITIALPLSELDFPIGQVAKNFFVHCQL